MIYYADIKNNEIEGYYCKEIHGDKIPISAVPISEELWQHLITENKSIINDNRKVKTTHIIDNEIVSFTIEDKDLFSIKESILKSIETQEQKEIRELKEQLKELQKIVKNL